mmetsp:Transcript_24906/g.34968  ORF Transcript_24906/g.34968 Transcript_24906/m.34968 type:complete len:98 (+) Transcript_24906:339-632(+)
MHGRSTSSRPSSAKADASGKITFEFERVSGHVHLSGIALGKVGAKDDGKCPGKKISGDCDEVTDQATCDGAYMSHHGMFVRCGWKTNDQCLSNSDCE